MEPTRGLRRDGRQVTKTLVTDGLANPLGLSKGKAKIPSMNRLNCVNDLLLDRRQVFCSLYIDPIPPSVSCLNRCYG